MANRFLNNIRINDEYTLPAADGTADQIITTDGAGQLSFVDPSTIIAGTAEKVVIYAKNTHTAQIAKGTPVYITGTVGATDTVQIAPADASNSAKMPAVGILDATLAVNAFGYVITGGFMDNITTDPIDGATPSSNDTVYVKAGGGLTLTKPTTAANLIQNIAKVGKVSGGNAGSLIVSSILRTNDVPNLNTGKIWVGQGNTIESSIVFLDEPNGRMGIGTTSPLGALQVNEYTVGAQGNQTVHGELSVFANSGNESLFLGIRNATYPNRGWAFNPVTNGVNSDLQIKEHGSSGVRMTIKTGGNIGIGTTSPSEKLDIEGSGSTNLEINNTLNSISLTLGAQATAARLTAGTGNRLGFGANNTADQVTISTSGNVGIGTTNPGAKLEISSTDNVAAIINSTSAFTFLDFENDGANRVQVGNASDGDFIIRTSDAERLRVDSNGNVGIGTANPSAKLHVVDTGSTSVTHYLKFNNEGSAYGGLTIGSTGADLKIRQNAGYGYFDATGFSFNYDTGRVWMNNGSILDVRNSSNSTVFYIPTSGNVGIGTTSPDTKLDIEDSNPFVTIQGNSSSYVNAGVQFISNQASAARGLGNFYYSAHSDVEWFSGLPYGSNDAFVINRNASYTVPSSQSSPPGIGASAGTLLKVNSSGAIQFNTYSGTNKTGTPTYLLGTDASGNVVKTNTIPGSAAGPYLPLAGGTMTGNLKLNDNVQLQVGSSADLQILHDASDSFLINNTGDLYLRNLADDKDIIFQSDDGSGGVETYIYIDGSGERTIFEKNTRHDDNIYAAFGSDSDLRIYHDGTDNYIRQASGTGDLIIEQAIDDKDIIFKSDDGSGGVENYIQIDGSAGRTLFNKNIRVNDNVQVQVGNSADLQIYHDGTNSVINNLTGHLQFYNQSDDKDIEFISDNGSGGLATYFKLWGAISSLAAYKDMLFVNDGDGGKLKFGASQDLQIYHEGTDSIIQNYTGSIYIDNNADDQDITFRCDNGSGGLATYFRIDGSQVENTFLKDTRHFDNIKAYFGDSGDLQIYHDGSNSYIDETGTGSLYIKSASAIRLQSATGENMIYAQNDAGVTLYHNNINKLTTTSTGVTVTGTATATTFSGDLNGTINTATTAVTKPNATNDTTVATTAFVQNLIGTIPAGLVFQGTWNAATNTPTLSSGSGTTGHFYIVSTDGSTNLDGITDWKVGDWAVFVEQGATDAWEKVDNSSVLDGSGTGQKVTMWSGSGTSNTLTNAPITVSGDNATFAGDVTVTGSTYLDGFVTIDHNLDITSSGVIRMGGTEVISAARAINATSGTFSGDVDVNGTQITVGSNNSIFAENNLRFKSSGAAYIDHNTTGQAINFRTSVSSSLDTTPLILSGANATFAGNVRLPNGGKLYTWTDHDLNYLKYDIWRATASAGMTIENISSEGEIYLKSGNALALTLDDSQNATFAGTIDSKAITALAKGAQLGTSGYYINSTFKDTGDNVGVFLAHNDTANGTGAIAGINQLAFLTYGSAWTQALLLDSNQNATFAGDVGIGVSPSQPLDVNGTALIRNTIYVGDDIQHWGDGGTGMFFGTDTISLKNDGGSTRLFVKSGGNVGIGTTSPSSKLHVVGANLGNTSGNEVTLANIKGVRHNLEFKNLRTANSTDWNSTTYRLQNKVDTTNMQSIDFVTDASYNRHVDINTASNAFNTRFTHNGRVGIGTTNPNEKLHAAGNIHAYDASGINAALFASTAAGSTTIAIRSSGITHFNGGNVGIGATNPLVPLHLENAADILAIFSSTDNKAVITIKDDDTTGYISAENARMSFGANTGANANNFNIDLSTNNVGIGTTSPGAKLQIGSATYAPNANLGNNLLQIKSPSGFAYLTIGNGDSANSTSYIGGASGFTVIGSVTDAGVLSEHMRITNAGKVGIGATNPAEKLEVSGSIKSGNLKIENSNGGRIGLNRNTSTGAIYNNSYGAFQLQNNGTGFFELQSYNSSGTYTGVLSMLESNGNVGIGTTNPGYKLDVAGTSRSDLHIFRSNQSAPTADAFIFRPADNTVALGTANAERVRVDSSGNVGIGTTNPYGRLNVIPSSNPTSPTAANQITVGESSSNSLYNLRLGYFLEGGAYKGSIQAIAGNTPNTLVLNGDGGNVGIGTTSPAYKLDVSGTVRLKNSASELVIDNSAYSEMRYGSANYFRADGSYATVNGPVVRFEIGGAEKMRVHSNGNVGIGTTSPDSTLHVLGPNSASGGITLSSSDSNNTQKVGRIKTSHYSNSEEPFTAILTNAQASNNVLRLGGGSGGENAATEILFYTAANNTTLTGSERMRIDSSGNVMIGNTSAAAKLDIRQDSGVAIRCEDGTGGYFVVNQGGDTGIGTTNPAEKLTVSGDSNITGKLAVGTDAAHGTYDFYNQNTAYFNGAVTVDDTITVTNLTYEATTSSGDYHGEIVYFGSGTLTAGGLYVLGNSSGTLVWSPAQDSTAALATGLLAIALGTSVSSGLLVRGHAQNSNWGLGWTVGDKLYLSPTAGSISNSLTTGSNDFVRIIGYYLGSNKIYFCPDNTFVQNVA